MSKTVRTIVKYEFHKNVALPKVERLWCEATDWSDWFDHLRRWFEASPSGNLHIVVVSDTASGELVGQFCFMQALVMVNGEQIRAARPFGTIVTAAMRDAFIMRHPLDHPTGAMYDCAVEELKTMGNQLIYMIPDPRWIRLFKMFPHFQMGSFPLWSLPVPFIQPIALNKAYTVAPLKKWDERVDRLWEKSSRLYGCAVVRDCAALRWKLADTSFTTTTVEKDGELIGLVASRHKGDRQWLVCDMLCADADDSMRATLAAASNVAHEKSVASGGKDVIHKVAVLTTPLMETVVRDLGFVRDAYDFPIIVHILDPKIAAEDVAPARWYISGND